MSFGHEQLDGYRLSLEYVSWSFELSDKLTGKHRHVRDQWLRYSVDSDAGLGES